MSKPVASFSLFAPAKVNLALHVLGRRADGYHELDSIVAFADVGDRLTFTPDQAFAITVEGPFAAAVPEARDNIISKAWGVAQGIAARRGRKLPAVMVHLQKNLPVASGIGGGSANAAAALRGFLRLVDITDIDAEVMSAGLSIGADVPVCLSGRACRMQGVGERIMPLADFPKRHAILVNPLVAVPTPAVFRGLGLAAGQSFGAPIEALFDPTGWRNDLASSAIAIAPVIGEVLQRLRNTPGASRSFMSGSGATCVALCDTPNVELDLDPSWWAARTLLG